MEIGEKNKIFTEGKGYVSIPACGCFKRIGINYYPN